MTKPVAMPAEDRATDGFNGTPGAILWACRRQVQTIARRVESLRACARAEVDMPGAGIEEIVALRREVDHLERGFRECLAGRKGGVGA